LKWTVLIKQPTSVFLYFEDLSKNVIIVAINAPGKLIRTVIHVKVKDSDYKLNPLVSALMDILTIRNLLAKVRYYFIKEKVC
jgi:hypothetical protein